MFATMPWCYSSISQAFLKKLAILPWPFFPADFPLVLLDGLVVTVFSFLGSGSSSEKDSHTASSLVTGHVSSAKQMQANKAYLGSRLRP